MQTIPDEKMKRSIAIQRVKSFLRKRMPQSNLTGIIDEVSETFVRGWAISNGKPPKLVVMRNGQVVSMETLKVFRSDLTHLYGGHENFGFEIRFSPNLEPNEIVSVTDASGRHLRRSPIHLERPSTLWMEEQDSAKTIIGLHYLRGSGIEIGALNKPATIPKHASIAYVDRSTTKELREIYPELHTVDFVEPDIIDDAETLQNIADNTHDFVVSSHVLEHLEDPIRAINNHMRVLKPGGIVYLALPERTRTSDMHREPTSIEHLVKDHHEGPSGSRNKHYCEWAYFNEGARGDAAAERAMQLEKLNYSIHFHVWSLIEFLELIALLKREYCPSIKIVLAKDNNNEFLVVLRKSEDF